jgi:hypothetical protein
VPQLTAITAIATHPVMINTFFVIPLYRLKKSLKGLRVLGGLISSKS